MLVADGRGEVGGAGVGGEDAEDARVPGQQAQRGAPRRDDHDRDEPAPDGRVEERAGDRPQGGGAPGARRPGDREARPLGQQVDADRREGVAADADQRPQGGRGEELGVERHRLAVGDADGQLVHAQGTPAARKAPVPGRARPRDLLQRGGLPRGGRILAEDADLRHARRGAGPGGFERASRRHGGGDLPGPQAAAAVVVRVAHAQDEAAAEGVRDPPAETGAAAGDDGAQPGVGALREEPGDPVGDALAVVLPERAEEVLPAVEEQHHPGEPVGGGDGGALLGEGREARLGEHAPAAVDLGGEHGEEPLAPVGLVASDDGAAVRQGEQRQQRVRAAVDGVQVDVVGRAGGGERPGEGAQRGGAARPRVPREVQVASGRQVEGERLAGPGVGHVRDAERHRGDVHDRASGGGPGRQRHLLGQGVRPGGRLARRPRPPGRLVDRLDEDAEVGGHAHAPARAASAVLGLAGARERMAEIPPGQRPDGGPPAGGTGAGAASPDPRDLHRPRLRRARPDEAPAGVRAGDPRGGVRAEHRGGLGRPGGAQRDAHARGVADVVGDGLAGPPGGEEQVDAEVPAAAGDAGQAGDEPRRFRGRGELADRDDEAGHGRQVPPGGPQLVVGGEVLHARVLQGLLAAAELGGEGLQGAFGGVLVQVADHADGVGEAGAVQERRAAPPVDEDERHLVGPVRHGERRDEGPQRLGRARAGSAGDEPVRPVGAKVDLEPFPVARRADGDAGRPAAGARPGLEDVVGRGVRHAEDVQEAHLGRERVRGGLVRHVPDGGECARHPFGPRRRHLVGQDGAEDVQPLPEPDRGRVLGVPRGHGAALFGEGAFLVLDAHRVEAELWPAREEHRHPRQAAQRARAVQDDQDVVGDGAGAPPLGHPHRQLGDAVRGRLRVRADEGHAVLALAGRAVRQPAHPVPVVPGVPVGGQDDHREVAGAVEDRGLRRHPAGQRARRPARAGHPDHAQLRERERHRHLPRERHPGRVSAEGGRLPVPNLLHGVNPLHGVGADQLDAGGQVRETGPQVQRVGVAEAALPQPPPGAGRGQQHLGGIGVQRPPLGLVLAPQPLQLVLERGRPAPVLLQRRPGGPAPDHPDQLARAPVGRLGDLQPPLPPRRDLPRRRIERQAALRERLQMGVGGGARRERQDARPHGQQRSRRPLRPAGQLRPVERGAALDRPRGRLHLHGPASDREPQRPGRHRGIVQHHVHVAPGAHGADPEAEPVHRPGRRAADDAHLDQPGRLAEDGGGRPVPLDRHDGAVPQLLDGEGLRVEHPPVHPEGPPLPGARPAGGPQGVLRVAGRRHGSLRRCARRLRRCARRRRGLRRSHVE